jgi:hypothetical protein
MKDQRVTAELPTDASRRRAEKESAAPTAIGNGTKLHHTATPFYQIPESLRSLFLARRWVARDAAKVPYFADGQRASSSDPSTWRTYAEACNVVARSSSLCGVGIMLGALESSGDVLAGVDLDGCLDPETGELEPHAEAIVGRLASYWEISPSGRGLKAYFLVSLADVDAVRSLARSLGFGGEHRFAVSQGNHRETALDLGGRYYAVTGDAFARDPALRGLGVALPEPLGRVSLADLRCLLTEGMGRSEPADILDLVRPHDKSRSARLMTIAAETKRAGRTFGDFVESARVDRDAWAHVKDQGDSLRAIERAWSRAEAPAERPPSRLSLLTPDQCAAAPARGYVIKGLIAPGDVGCIFGAPGAGKSVIAPALAYAVAQGRPAFGLKTRQGSTLYVAAEDPSGMRSRVSALRIRHGDAPGFALVEGVGDLLTPTAPDLEALEAIVAERRPTLIVLDTLAMAFPGLEENSAEAMGRVVAVARRLAAHGSAVVLVHHDTKAEGATPRGHSILNGALDVALQVLTRGEDGVVRTRMTKNRNGPCRGDLAFTIGIEELGIDEDGDAITAAVCVEAMDAPAQGPKLSASERGALHVLAVLENVSGGEVQESRWREACIDGTQVSGSEERASRRKATDRAIRRLTQLGLVKVEGGIARRAGTGPGDLFADLDSDGVGI